MERPDFEKTKETDPLLYAYILGLEKELKDAKEEIGEVGPSENPFGLPWGLACKISFLKKWGIPSEWFSYKQELELELKAYMTLAKERDSQLEELKAQIGVVKKQ